MGGSLSPSCPLRGSHTPLSVASGLSEPECGTGGVGGAHGAWKHTHSRGQGWQGSPIPQEMLYLAGSLRDEPSRRGKALCAGAASHPPLISTEPHSTILIALCLSFPFYNLGIRQLPCFQRAESFN